MKLDDPVVTRVAQNHEFSRLQRSVAVGEGFEPPGVVTLRPNLNRVPSTAQPAHLPYLYTLQRKIQGLGDFLCTLIYASVDFRENRCYVVGMAENEIRKQLDAVRKNLAVVEMQIDELRSKRDILKAKVEAFELSAKYFEDAQAKQGQPPKKRVSKAQYRKIFKELYERYNDGFGYDEIDAVASSMGIEVKRNSLRSKMMHLTDNGYVERIDDGNFSITKSGADYLEIAPILDEFIDDEIQWG